jgi:hypothetical protein
MGVSRWFNDRRADSVSHGVFGRVVYTVVVILLGVEIFKITLLLGAPLAFVITGFTVVFGGLPFLAKVWAPSATAKNREIAERQRIDPEPSPREFKAPKRW